MKIDLEGLMAERHWSEARRYWEEQRYKEESVWQTAKVSRAEIEALKSYITQGGSDAYVEMMRVIQHPMAVVRARIYPQTRVLQLARTFLSLFNSIFILIAPLVLLFTTRWWWAVAAVAFWYFALNWIQTAVNIELGARLIAIDQKGEGLDEERDASRIDGRDESSPPQGTTGAAVLMSKDYSFRLDMAILGAWYMDTRSRDFSLWSETMRSDSDIRGILAESVGRNEEQFLWGVYNWSSALLFGAYHLKDGRREYDVWCERLLSDLDEDTQEQIRPSLREFYDAAKEMENSIGRTFSNKPLRPNGVPYDGSKYTVVIPSEERDHYLVLDSAQDAMIVTESRARENHANSEQAPSLLHDTCPRCGEPLKLKKARFGLFWVCSDYPRDSYVRAHK